MASKPTGISRLKPPTKVFSFDQVNTSKPVSSIIPQLRKNLRRSKSFDLNFVRSKVNEVTVRKRKASLTKSTSTTDVPAIKLPILKQTLPTNKTIPRVPTATRVNIALPAKKVVTVNKSSSTTTNRIISKPGTSRVIPPREKENKPVSVIASRKRRSEVKPEGVWKKPAKFVDFKTRYNTLSEKFKQKAHDLNELTEQNADLTKKIEEVVIEATKLKEENEKLKTEVNTQFSRITKLNTNNESLQSEVRSLKDTLNFTKQNLSEKSNEVIDCHERLRIADNERRYLLNTIQDLKGNIRVFCRVRPPLSNEKERELAQISVLDEMTMELQKSSADFGSARNCQGKMEFTYDKIFPQGTSQEIVFEDLSELVQSTLDGYNICVFAYGQTGSGKTFTMQGNKNNLGMIPRAIGLLFKKIEEMNTLGWTYTIQASFLEIYNETIVDLLNPNPKQQYDIRHTKNTTTVTNLTRQQVYSADELYRLMCTALQNRSVASTNFNEHSSRSHALTKIDIEGVQAVTNLIHTSSMNLVDLAGSESAKTTANERLKETKNINKSLSALGNVMLSLYNKDSHVPYRDSKLTYLLQPCLGGNSKTLMIVNIAPFEDTFNETISSLRFAAKVKEVKINVKRNRILNTSKY